MCDVEAIDHTVEFINKADDIIIHVTSEKPNWMRESIWFIQLVNVYWEADSKQSETHVWLS